MTIHTSFRKGQRIRLIMKVGPHETGKFVENKSRFVVLSQEGVVKKFAIKDIRSAVIERNP